MKTLIALIKIIINLFSQNKYLRITKKLDKENKREELDALIAERVQEWAKYIVSISGKNTKVNVTGLENVPKDTACVFIGNHQGDFDIPVLLGYIPKQKAFIAKAEILRTPMLASWMKLMRCTFLVRNNPRQSIQAFNEAVENVKKGYSQVIFPEGHRSKGGPMKEFKAGSFKLAFRSEVPIVPFTIDGTWRLFEEKGLNSGIVNLTIHPPIETKGLTKEEQIAIPAKVQEIVASALENT